MQKLILVTGTPGVGKSELARSLARRLGAAAVDLTLLVKTEKLTLGFDRSRGSVIVDERRVRKRLVHELSRGRDLVVATHTVGRILPQEADARAIVLRLDPLVLYRRLIKRRWTNAKIWENVESELLDVCYFDAINTLGPERVFELNSAGLSKRELVQKALRITKRRVTASPRVNWLNKYDPIELERRLIWKDASS